MGRKQTYWGLHGKEGKYLQQVILDDISDDAVLIKVSAPPFSAKVFTENDLHVANVLPTPKGLKYEIGKSQDLQKS